MTVEGSRAIDETMTAGEDLSNDQFKFVKLSANRTVIKCTALTDRPIGVLQDDPLINQGATVRMIGISKLSSDAALAFGDLIGTSADSQGDVKIPGTDTTEFIVGHVVAGSGAADELASVAINCMSPARAA